MPKTLAELRAEKTSRPTPRRPERSLTVCLAPDLVAEVQRLNEELATLTTAPARDTDGKSGPPRRAGDSGEDPRGPEIRQRMRELLDEMADNEGELRVRAIEDGAWRRWCNEHPARDEGEPGHLRDQEVAGGYCNADELIDDLATYAYAWNGEPLDDGDWASLLEAQVSGADKKQIATAVVTMHESRLDFPSWRSGLYANLERSSSSASRSPLGSPTSGSSAGRPKSGTSTTTPPES